MFHILFNTKRTASNPQDHRLAELADKLNDAIASAKLAVYSNGVGGRICHVAAHYHGMFYYILSKYISIIVTSLVRLKPKHIYLCV